jgi:2'-5' RNA ligase
MLLGYNSDELEAAPGQRYAVVILIPEHLHGIIAPVRRRFDPDYAVVHSHVTIVFPFRSEKSAEVISRAIKTATEKTPPIPIALSSIGDFYPSFPLIYWGVNRDNVLDGLYKSLYAALDLALPHKHYAPHVTVAREISPHRVVMVKEEIVPYLPDESFVANSIDLLSPTDGCKWVSVQNFPLGQ